MILEMDLKKNPKDFGDKFNKKIWSLSDSTIFWILDGINQVVVNKFFVGIRVKYMDSVGDPVEKETSSSTW